VLRAAEEQDRRETQAGIAEATGATAVGAVTTAGLGWQLGGEPLWPGGQVPGALGSTLGTQSGGIPTVPAGHVAAGATGVGAAPPGTEKQ
jgi:hypothetical protein